MPVAAQHDEISEHWTCSICLNIPLHPKLLPCEHLFCAECLDQLSSRLGLQAGSKLCPNCRSPFYATDAVDSAIAIHPGSFLFRLWGSIRVHCAEQACQWTGPVSTFQAHLDACHHGMEGRHRNAEMVKKLKEENTALKKKIRSLRQSMENLKAEHQQQRITMQHEMNEQIDSYKTELQHLRANTIVLDESYQYNRYNVVRLSQLIAQHLENKPDHINANRIYNCVKACYDCFSRGYSDNPQNYYVDIRMLLTTCSASAWFSPNQNNNIDSWLSEHGWYGY